MKNKSWIALGVLLIVAVILVISPRVSELVLPPFTRIYPTPWPILLTRGLPTPTPLPRPVGALDPAPPVRPISVTTAALLGAEERLVYSEAWASVERCKGLMAVYAERCAEIIDVQVERIRKPEWDQLWSEVHFYLVTNIGAYQVRYAYHPANPYLKMLYAVHKGWVYTADEGVAWRFNELLAANRIEVTEANRDLVAKAFILTAMDASRLAGDVTFSAPRAIDEEGPFSTERLVYYLESWTQIQGRVYAWRFAFYPSGQIELVTRYLLQEGVGEYSPISYEQLPDEFGSPWWYAPNPTRKEK